MNSLVAILIILIILSLAGGFTVGEGMWFIAILFTCALLFEVFIGRDRR